MADRACPLAYVAAATFMTGLIWAYKLIAVLNLP